MRDIAKCCRVALVQAEPCMFDKKASLEKHLNILKKRLRKSPTSSFFRSFSSPAIPSE